MESAENGWVGIRQPNGAKLVHPPTWDVYDTFPQLWAINVHLKSEAPKADDILVDIVVVVAVVVIAVVIVDVVVVVVLLVVIFSCHD